MTTPELVEFAIEVAQQAGALTLKWFQSDGLEVSRKGDGSPVTAADLAAETEARRLIEARFPDDGIMGEEQADVDGSSGRIWVIDPIDGTKAFSRGVPLYATLVALVDETGPAVGVIHLPGLNETVAAGRNLGATYDGQPCRVSDHASLDGAYVMTSEHGYWPADQLKQVLNSPVDFRTWGDAYGYALVASGRAEAMVDPKANPWDVAPAAVIIPEAGGLFTATTGSDAEAWRSGSGLASNGKLHPAMVELLSRR